MKTTMIRKMIAAMMLIALALLAVSCTEAPVPAAPSAAAPAGADEKAETEAPAQTEEPAAADEPAVTDEPKGNTIYDMYPSLAEAKKYEEEHELSVMDRFYNNATDEQWKELQNAPELAGFAPSVQSERLLREILGDIPEGTPRITLEQARKILSEYDQAEGEDALVKRFSEYAVPDINFGDIGMLACFFLDDEAIRYIEIWPTSVIYRDRETYTKEVLWEIEG